MMRPRVPSLALFAAAAALSASPAAAQVVVGTVLERGTARPLEGAFVVLLDAEGDRQGGVLTGPEGDFVLRAAAPGRYRLVAELIGYRSTETEPLDLQPGPAVRHDIEVAVQAITLDGIEVETAQRCRPRPGAGGQTARLWDEARKALEVTRLGGTAGVLRFLVVSYTREVDARSLRVVSQVERPRRAFLDRSPYRSIPVEALDEHGYVRRDADGEFHYFAPDAEVLLSDEFLDTHCFHVAAPPPDQPGLIGLAFEPIEARELPDVSGVLWLERATAELRRLDFTYDNLPFRHGDWSQVGGRVEFERLATGMWIVRRWRIRMPMVAEESGGYGMSTPTLRLVTLSEQGAEIREVTTPSGRVLAQALGATLYGTITQAGTEEGIEGAVVELPALHRQATTGPDGTFRMTDLPEGVFDVFVTHAAHQQPAHSDAPRAVTLRSGAAARYVAELERRAVAGPEILAGEEAATWVNGVVGRVVTAAGDPLPGATARLLSRAGEEIDRMDTDALGRFQFIHPGMGSDYILEVGRPGYGSYRKEILIQNGREYEVRITLDAR